MKMLAAGALILCLTLLGCGNSSVESDPANFTQANTATTKVSGMTCVSCEGSVCSAIKDVEGVKDVQADAKTGEVKIALEDGAKLDVDAVKKAIAAASFEAGEITLPEGFCPAGCTKACCKGEAKPAEETDNDAETDTDSDAADQVNANTQDTFFVSSYKVSGMTCDGCSGEINNALAKVPGVNQAKADHKTGTVVVEFADGIDGETKSEEVKKIIAALSDGKYTVGKISTNDQ